MPPAPHDPSVFSLSPYNLKTVKFVLHMRSFEGFEPFFAISFLNLLVSSQKRKGKNNVIHRSWPLKSIRTMQR